MVSRWQSAPVDLSPGDELNDLFAAINMHEYICRAFPILLKQNALCYCLASSVREDIPNERYFSLIALNHDSKSAIRRHSSRYPLAFSAENNLKLFVWLPGGGKMTICAKFHHWPLFKSRGKPHIERAGPDIDAAHQNEQDISATAKIAVSMKFQDDF